MLVSRMFRSCHAAAMQSSVLISFIIQYFRHPHQLPIICSRLQHPALEIIVHLDSDEPDDAAALDELAPLARQRWQRYLGSRGVLLDAAATETARARAA